MKQMHLPTSLWKDVKPSGMSTALGALFLILGEPGAHHRGGALAPGQRLGLSPRWAGSRKRENYVGRGDGYSLSHSLVGPEPRDLGEAFGWLGDSLAVRHVWGCLFDCSQCKRHLLLGLCLRALLTAFLTSYF